MQRYYFLLKCSKLQPIYRHFLMPLAYDAIAKRMMQNERKVIRGECKQNVKLYKYTKRWGRRLKRLFANIHKTSVKIVIDYN